MTLHIACQCGKLRGEIDLTRMRPNNHLLCYCGDCQAFANHLGRPETLDAHGGTEIVQVPAGAVRLTEGLEHLACLRLTPEGLHRWYASCCKTPIGNAPGTGLPFVGIVHDCLTPSEQIDETFGPISLVVFTKAATGEPRPKDRRFVQGMLKFMWVILRARLRGDAARHPLFDSSGQPVVSPEVLSG